MALSNILKESIQDVLKEHAHMDSQFINKLVESIESSFYSKKGTTPAKKEDSPKAREVIKESDSSGSAMSRMKEILTPNAYASTGLAIPQPDVPISTQKSAMSSMKRILS